MKNSPQPCLQLRQSRIKRFLEQVRKTNSCWWWTGSKDRFGYGYFKSNGRRIQGAHRFSFCMANGFLPSDKCICHSCDHPSCVNPSHLFIGTRAENFTDKLAKGRQAKGEKMHCAKLTESKVREIRYSYAAGGVTTTQLASRYHISQGVISRTINRKAWRHVA